MGTDWRRFKMVRIRDIRNYPSDSFALQDRILIYPRKEGHQCSTIVLLAQIGAVHGVREDDGSY